MTFKFKYTRIEVEAEPISAMRMPKRRVGMGLYQQLKSGNQVNYNTQPFTMDTLKQAMGGLLQQPVDRKVKIITNQAGLDMFNEAMAEQLKQKENEYRKRFSFKSEIFKQTYKFRQ